MLGFLLLAVTIQLPKDTDFQPYHEEDGVTVQIARKESGPPWVRGAADLPATVDAAAAVLGNYAGYQEFLAGMVKTVKVLEQEKDSARLHFVYPFPFPFRNRDAVVAYQHEKKDGRFRVWWREAPKPGDPTEGVRIERVEGETRVEPAGKQARVTYTYLADLGGDFSEGTRERAYKKEAPHYINALKKAISAGAQKK